MNGCQYFPFGSIKLFFISFLQILMASDYFINSWGCSGNHSHPDCLADLLLLAPKILLGCPNDVNTRFYVVHTLPMSDFCIYPHSGIPQGLKGLILVKNPLIEAWFKILPSGGASLPPSLGYVTSTAIDHYPSLWKKFHTHIIIIIIIIIIIFYDFLTITDCNRIFSA
jgi:hypothetical protein